MKSGLGEAKAALDAQRDSIANIGQTMRDAMKQPIEEINRELPASVSIWSQLFNHFKENIRITFRDIAGSASQTWAFILDGMSRNLALMVQGQNKFREFWTQLQTQLLQSGINNLLAARGEGVGQSGAPRRSGSDGIGGA